MGIRRDDPKAYMASYREANRDRLRSQNRASKKRCRLANPEKHQKQSREQQSRFRARHPERQSLYEANNKDSIRVRRRGYDRNRYRNCVVTRITQRLRNRFLQTLNGERKGVSVLRLVGCSVADLRDYIEAQFIAGMTWENYGEWHIDHRTPLCSVNPTTDRGSWDALWHYTNLRPLWASDNCRLGALARPRKPARREPARAFGRKRGALPRADGIEAGALVSHDGSPSNVVDAPL